MQLKKTRLGPRRKREIITQAIRTRKIGPNGRNLTLQEIRSLQRKVLGKNVPPTQIISASSSTTAPTVVAVEPEKGKLAKRTGRPRPRASRIITGLAIAGVAAGIADYTLGIQAAQRRAERIENTRGGKVLKLRDFAESQRDKKVKETIDKAIERVIPKGLTGKPGVLKVLEQMKSNRYYQQSVFIVAYNRFMRNLENRAEAKKFNETEGNFWSQKKRLGGIARDDLANASVRENRRASNDEKHWLRWQFRQSEWLNFTQISEVQTGALPRGERWKERGYRYTYSDYSDGFITGYPIGQNSRIWMPSSHYNGILADVIIPLAAGPRMRAEIGRVIEEEGQRNLKEGK
ncbi:MAG: hypothetical protein Q7S92_07035 [Candidatus Diapherotrites archaeon]|nr:hypothetical protein [Candidatus Diapherotrites archaeon]